MSDAPKLSKLEALKLASRQLRGTLAEELANDLDHFSGDATQLLKHHGSYQQDDRDLRKAKNEDGTPKGKSYICMVRSRIPGGTVSADAFLAELDLCDWLGNGTLRITTRQGLQLHGVLKSNIRETIRAINQTHLTTLAACGDVCRNFMCCPAPLHQDSAHADMQATVHALAAHFKPRTTAYTEVWLEDEQGERTDVSEFQPVEEPIYGERYLPRKFKMGVALPEDNCVDVLSNDLGLLAIVEQGAIVGYNLYVGGGMGMTPAKKNTFPAVAKKLTFVTPDEVIPVAEAIVKVQRDFGNRSDRKIARLKYLIADWGLEKFQTKVEEYYGRPLTEPRPQDPCDVSDHVGWHEQGDGKLFLGLNIENGRIKDDGDLRIKTGLRTIVEKFRPAVHLTALQSLLLCNVDPANRDEIDALLAEHGIKQADDLSLTRRYSIACPALPTCGLAVTESERALPAIIDAIEVELAKHDLSGERISVHSTGCPNGCARSYTSDVGLVGKAAGKYTLYLGGDAVGSRLNFLYADMVPQDQVATRLSPLLAYFREEREPGESFGDFCLRKGKDDLAGRARSSSA